MKIKNKYWFCLVFLTFMSIAKERSMPTMSYLDKLNKHIRLYFNYILGRSTSQEKRMLKKRVKKDAAVAMGGSAVVIGGAIIAVKMASPSALQKLKKCLQKDSVHNQTQQASHVLDEETIIGSIKTMFSNKQLRRNFIIGNHTIYVITDKGSLNFIFKDTILKDDFDISLEDINKTLVDIVGQFAKENITSRVFIPINNPFNDKSPFDKKTLTTGDFMEYYQQGITKWDWTNEFCKNKKGNF